MKNKGARWLSAFPIRAIALTVLILLIALVYVAATQSWTGDPVSGPVPQQERALVSAKAEATTKLAASAPVYRHSVIPGGVRQSAELSSALERDQFARAHYANFDAANASIVHLKAPRLVHVSYRMGDKIYWTRKKVRLTAGETLLTDGKSFVRTRCGNRIADTAQPMVSDKEPAPEELDMVIAPPRALLNRTSKSTDNAGPPTGPANGFFYGAENFPPAVPPTTPSPIHPPVNPGVPGVPIPGVLPPPFPSFPIPPVVEIPDNPTREVPEPASFGLVLAALVSLILIRLRTGQKWRKNTAKP